MSSYSCSFPTSPIEINQNTSRKAQSSSFSLLFHFHQLKSTKTSSNGRTIEEEKGVILLRRCCWPSPPQTIRSTHNIQILLVNIHQQGNYHQQNHEGSQHLLSFAAIILPSKPARPKILQFPTLPKKFIIVLVWLNYTANFFNYN